MDIDNIVMLPKVITESVNLEDEFKELFSLPEARKAKSVVYFFRSVHPVSRLKGKSDILYIGKTKQSIRARYLRYSAHLASGPSGRFYNYIIQNYGGLRLGYISTETPQELERIMFKEYRLTYLENPPKSKVG